MHQHVREKHNERKVDQVYQMEKPRARGNLPREQIRKALYRTIVRYRISALSDRKFPNASGNNLRDIAERMNIIVVPHLLDVIVHKTIEQRIAVEQKHKQTKHACDEKVFLLLYCSSPKTKNLCL